MGRKLKTVRTIQKVRDVVQRGERASTTDHRAVMGGKTVREMELEGNWVTIRGVDTGETVLVPSSNVAFCEPASEAGKRG